MGLVLFETTESVIEVLWDIALAFFVIRLALVYFLTVFASGLALSYLAATSRLLTSRHLTTPQSELVLAPLLLVLAACWSRFLIVHYEIPRVAAFRASIGGLALLMVLGAEAATGALLYEGGRGDWIFETDARAAAALAALLVAYGLMPLVMMWFERPERVQSTYHGHERKSMVDAVPTVRAKTKEEAEERKNK